MSDGGKSVFAKYVEEPEKEQQPVTIPRGPLLQPIVPPTDSNSPPIEQLLDFLINHWSEPTINARTIHWRGPSCARNRKSVIELAEALVAAAGSPQLLNPAAATCVCGKLFGGQADKRSRLLQAHPLLSQLSRGEQIGQMVLAKNQGFWGFYSLSYSGTGAPTVNRSNSNNTLTFYRTAARAV